MNIEAYDLNSLRGLVRSLQKENLILKKRWPSCSSEINPRFRGISRIFLPKVNSRAIQLLQNLQQLPLTGKPIKLNIAIYQREDPHEP